MRRIFLTLVLLAVAVVIFPTATQALPGYCKAHPERAGCSTPPPPPPTPAAPVANFSVSPNPAVRNSATTFTSTGTCAATPCIYRWFHGDATSTDEIEAGAAQPNTSASFTYTGAAGTRTVTLKVTDNLARSSTKTTTFNLVDAPPPPPPADSDSDGVTDANDACPGTPIGTPVDSRGCPVTPPPPPPGGFPDASNTGYPQGTTFTRVSGELHLTTPGQVVNAVEADYVTVDAANVTIKNSYIHGMINSNSGSVTVMDTTIDGGYNGTCPNGIAWSNYTIIRVEITGCENGATAGTNAVIQDSWIHIDRMTTANDHNDGVQANGQDSNVTIRHNTITSVDTSAIIMYTGSSTPGHDWTIDGNYLKNASTVLYCPRVNASNVFITNNTFDNTGPPPLARQYYTDSCVPGHFTTWSGNVTQTGATLPPS